MNTEINLLLATAASIAFLHTLMGPDHYLPFIMLSRAQKWSLPKTLVITVACGIAHVASSVVLGTVGIAAGLAVSRVQGWEGVRGNIAAYLLLGFGLAYAIWGLKKAWKGRSHAHPHQHPDGSVHLHDHSHQTEHTHVHPKAGSTVWWLFIIFILGPCEPLIPILMYPAAQSSRLGVAFVAGVFGLVTVATMTAIVTVSYAGLKQLRFEFLEKYSHALGGLAIFLCAAAILFLGL